MSQEAEHYGEEDLGVGALLQDSPIFSKPARKERSYSADEVDAYVARLRKALADEHEQKDSLTSSYQELKVSFEELSQKYNDLQLAVESNGTYNAAATERTLPTQSNAENDIWGAPTDAQEPSRAAAPAPQADPQERELLEAQIADLKLRNDALENAVNDLRRENDTLQSAGSHNAHSFREEEVASQAQSLHPEDIVRGLSPADKATAIIQQASMIAESHVLDAHQKADGIVEQAKRRAETLLDDERRKSDEADERYKLSLSSLNQVLNYHKNEVRELADFILYHQNSQDAFEKRDDHNVDTSSLPEVNPFSLEDENPSW